jgi:hypothetical protein
MSNDIVWVIFGATALILWRLDRLGKQLEAVCNIIKIDLAPTSERADEFSSEWKETRLQYKKDQRQFFIFWGIVVAVFFIWWFLRHSP